MGVDNTWVRFSYLVSLLPLGCGAIISVPGSNANGGVSSSDIASGGSMGGTLSTSLSNGGAGNVNTVVASGTGGGVSQYCKCGTSSSCGGGVSSCVFCAYSTGPCSDCPLPAASMPRCKYPGLRCMYSSNSWCDCDGNGNWACTGI